MDIVSLAVGSLAVAGPVLASGGEFIGAEVVKGVLAKLGQDGLEWVKSSWQRTQPAIQADVIATVALQKCQQQPDDSYAQEMLQKAITQILEQNAELRQAIVDSAPSSVVELANNTAQYHGDGGINVAGTGNQVVQGTINNHS